MRPWESRWWRAVDRGEPVPADGGFPLSREVPADVAAAAVSALMQGDQPRAYRVLVPWWGPWLAHDYIVADNFRHAWVDDRAWPEDKK